MFKKSRFVLICVIFSLICVISGYAQDETLTITTYYPSPYGSYREMRAQRMAIGDNYIRGGDFDWGDEIDNNADLVVEGNVGIGTPAPIEKLDVMGNVFLSGTNKGLRVQNAQGASFWVTTPQDGMISIGGTGATPPSSGPLNILATGNVGIGTTDPSERLEVNGGITVGNTTGTNAGTIRWTGTAFEGYNGTAWIPLGGGGGFGAWNDINNDGVGGDTIAFKANYQARTDGFAMAWVWARGGWPVLYGYTDNRPTPTTMRLNCNTTDTGGYGCSITMPVRKGDYWRIDNGDLAGVDVIRCDRGIRWIPIGN